MKFHIRTRLIEGFPTIFRTWWCAEEKLHFTPFHTLRQFKRDDARFHVHYLGGSQSFERGTGKYLYAGFRGRQNLESMRLRLRRNSTSHLFWPVQTCPNLFTIQWPCTLVAQFQFPPFEGFYFSVLHRILLKLHILAHLIESFPMMYSLCSCIKIKMSIPLRAHA